MATLAESKYADTPEPVTVMSKTRIGEPKPSRMTQLAAGRVRVRGATPNKLLTSGFCGVAPVSMAISPWGRLTPKLYVSYWHVV